MLENSERFVWGVRMGKSWPLELTELANQIQGFRILDRWDTSEKNKYKSMQYSVKKNVTDYATFLGLHGRSWSTEAYRVRWQWESKGSL